MVEALKKDKFLSELPKEEIEMSKVDITDNALKSKDGEILRLLNQIASDMVKRSDVDEIVKCQSLRLQGGPFNKLLQSYTHY